MIENSKKLIVFILFLLILSGCSSDDSSGPTLVEISSDEEDVDYEEEDSDEEEDSEDEVPLPIDEQEVPDPPDTIAMPSLEDYQRKWAEKLQLHSRERRAKYSRLNLVPKPVPQLWNDCPYVPFENLISEEATVRVQSHGSFPEQHLRCWHPQIRPYQRRRGLPKTLCLPAVIISGQHLRGCG